MLNSFLCQGENGSIGGQSCGDDSNSGFSLDEYKQTLTTAKDVRQCT